MDLKRPEMAAEGTSDMEVSCVDLFAKVLRLIRSTIKIFNRTRLVYSISTVIQ